MAAFFLFALVVASILTLLIGALLGVPAVLAVVVAVLVALGATVAAYRQAGAVALRMSEATPAPVEDYARYHNIVEGLCIASGLPKPRLYVIDDPAPNAFATGRNPRTAALAVTSGLLERLNRIELEGSSPTSCRT